MAACCLRFCYYSASSYIQVQSLPFPHFLFIPSSISFFPHFLCIFYLIIIVTSISLFIFFLISSSIYICFTSYIAISPFNFFSPFSLLILSSFFFSLLISSKSQSKTGCKLQSLQYIHWQVWVCAPITSDNDQNNICRNTGKFICNIPVIVMLIMIII